MRVTQAKAKYLVIDTETSGIHAYENGLIQLAALALDNQLEVLEEFNEYVKPPEGVVFSEESSLIHGISQESIDKGLSYREVCQSFVNFVRENFENKPILIGQFFPFDYAFLDAVFGKVAPEFSLFQSVLSRNFIDTKSLANVFNLKAEMVGRATVFSETSLSKPGGLKDSLSLNQSDYQSHNALDDCHATKDALLKMIDLLDMKKLAPIERNPYQS